MRDGPPSRPQALAWRLSRLRLLQPNIRQRTRCPRFRGSDPFAPHNQVRSPRKARTKNRVGKTSQRVVHLSQPRRTTMKLGLSGTLALVGFGLTTFIVTPAHAQTSGVGPYYATPSWNQTLPSATRFIVL